MLGGFLALLAAATFGLNNASVRRGVLTGSVAQGLAITVPIGVPLFLAGAIVSGTLGTVAEFSAEAYALLATAGIVHFVWGRYCNYRAIRAMGANLVGPVQQSSLLITLGGAIWLLDEVLTPLRLLGILLVVIGPVAMLRSRKAERRAPKAVGADATAAAGAAPRPAFEPRYGEGFLFALLSATGYGSSAILIRAAVTGMGPGGSLAGGVISYAAASLVIVVTFLRPGQLRHAFAIERNAAKWFTLSGIFVCVSQMFRYMALSIAPVTVVAPIQQTAIVFRLIFGWLINREHEVYSVWVLIGIFISLVGAVALTVSTEVVLALIDLPDWAVAFARLTWP